MPLPLGLRCRSWLVEVPEPGSRDPAARIAAQDQYLSSCLAAWCKDLDNASHTLGQVASFHFMRYLDPIHFPGWDITVVLRFLGTTTTLTAIQGEVTGRLNAQKCAREIIKFDECTEADWDATVLSEYGGPTVGPAFAEFLGAATRLTLDGKGSGLLTLHSVADNWAHCFRLITTGLG